MFFYKKYNRPPEWIALGFAAYIYFMKSVKQVDNLFYGEKNGKVYSIDDEQAGKFYQLWQTLSPKEIVTEVLKDDDLWGSKSHYACWFRRFSFRKIKKYYRSRYEKYSRSC